MPRLIEERFGSTPVVSEVPYDDLPVAVVIDFALGGDEAADAWLRAKYGTPPDDLSLTATFDQDQARDELGRWTEGAGVAADEPMRIVTTERGVRDQTVNSWGRNFTRDLNPEYMREVDEAVKAAIPGRPLPRPEPDTQANSIYRGVRGEQSGRPTGQYVTKRDELLVRAFVDDDKRALGALRAQATKIAREYAVDQVRPETVEVYRRSVREFEALPRAEALREKYGSPDVVFAAKDEGHTLDSLDIPSAHYNESADRIVLFENAFDRAGPPESKSGFGELRAGNPTITGGNSAAVFTHEFGHSVNAKMTDDEKQEWLDLSRGRIAEYRRDFAEALDVDAGRAIADRAISYYAMNGGSQAAEPKEAFAETFAAVMHPDYDRSLFHESNHAMLEWMENLVARA